MIWTWDKGLGYFLQEVNQMQLNRENLNILLNETIKFLQRLPNADLRTKQGTEFESVLQMALVNSVESLGFNNIRNIELVSGHKYPDLVLHTDTEKLGIEVKTSRSKGWSTLGGSIFESTRVQGVEDIMLFFANFNDLNNIQFRFAWMEDCISDVVITHKPRYAINMDINETFFKHSGVQYKELQKSDKPFSLIREYLKSRGGQYTDLWWVDESEGDDLSKIGPQSIREFISLSAEEKQKIKSELHVIFPEVLSCKDGKYVRASLFLTSKKGLISRSLRDMFSSGGKYLYKGQKIPKYFKYILEEGNVKSLLSALEQTPTEYFEEYWTSFNIDIPVKEQWVKEVSHTIRGNSNISDTLKEDIIHNINKRFR